MYEYTPDEIDFTRASYQAKQQSGSDNDVKRIGNLGELGFEQFCREYVPTEMWEWENDESIRRCNPDSYNGHDFEVFGHEIDVKTSRDVSSFLPRKLVELDSDDDIVVMVWHRDKEDSLILLGWEWVRGAFIEGGHIGQILWRENREVATPRHAADECASRFRAEHSVHESKTGQSIFSR